MTKITEIKIGDKIIDQITDDNGVNWYPLKAFLQRILCKYDKVTTFRDSAISRYMKVFEYNPKKNKSNRLVKTWFINENGVKYLLRHMSIRKTKNTKMYIAREKGFFEACIYFNVKNHDELEPLYINTIPDLKEYDIWSLLCITNDTKITNTTSWKKCPECGYYYPNKINYFGSNRKKQTKCLQCQNKNFHCDNKIIQYIYDNDGLDLLYKLYTSQKESVIIEALKNFINKGVVDNDN